MDRIFICVCVCLLSGPPSWATASTKRSWSSTVQRKRGLGSVVRTRPESPWTHIALFSYEPFILEGFLAWNILPLSLYLYLSLSLSLWKREFKKRMWCKNVREYDAFLKRSDDGFFLSLFRSLSLSRLLLFFFCLWIIYD